jgi:hypothetical protein
MSTRHTPGPWEVDGQYVQQVGNANIGICDVLNMDVGGDKGWYHGPVTIANTYLIAAAPELLEIAHDFSEVLQELGMFCECGQPNCRTTRLRAAIAKATGSAA